jgi:hypothetical protein
MRISTSLFKYRAFNKSSIELLVNRELWFAKPETLNDPFECQLSYERVLEAVWNKKEIAEQQQNNLKNELDKRLSELGICSFSRTRKNQLMWSHYSDEHRGFCIGFNENTLKNTSERFHSIPVDYQADLPYKKIIERFEYFESNEPLNNKISDIYGDILESVIGTKYTNWKYEKETRLVTYEFGALKFEPKSVVSIAFGLRMADRDKVTLKKLLNSPEWSHINLFQAEKAKDKFGLEFVKI